MVIPDVDAYTLALMRRMTAPQPSHERFVGEAVDKARIDGLALGDLWALAWATPTHADHSPVQSLAAETARTILALGRDREPLFRGAACRDYLDHLAREAESEPEDERGRFDLSWPLQHASFALNRCLDLTFEGLAPAAERLLAATPWRVMPHVAVALARLAGTACEARVLDKLAAELADSPLLVQELRAAAELDLARTSSSPTWRIPSASVVALTTPARPIGFPGFRVMRRSRGLASLKPRIASGSCMSISGPTPATRPSPCWNPPSLPG